MTPVSLSLASRTDLTLADFQAVAAYLDSLHDATKFWTGDLLVEAEARWGESAYQLAAVLKLRANVAELGLGL